MAQRKLSAGALLDANGRLAECGYATSLVKSYTRDTIKANAFRIKEWDYYLVYNSRFGLALTIADNGYMGLVSASFIDFTKPAERTKSIILPLTLGKLRLPQTSLSGNVEASGMRFHNDGKTRRLFGTMNDFGESALSFDVTLSTTPRDSMVIATPFAGKPNAFYYNQKIPAMRAEGEVSYNGQTYIFDKADSLGLLDWGRGVWPYESTWYWSAAQGIVDGRIIALNLGYGFGDTSAASENMLFADGIAHKLEQVDFGVPDDDLMRPWNFTSSDGRFEARFTPLLDRFAKTALGPLLSDQHQVFGYFDGVMRLDDGEIVKLERFLGFAEKVHNKW